MQISRCFPDIFNIDIICVSGEEHFYNKVQQCNFVELNYFNEQCFAILKIAFYLLKDFPKSTF